MAGPHELNEAIPPTTRTVLAAWLMLPAAVVATVRLPAAMLAPARISAPL